MKDEPYSEPAGGSYTVKDGKVERVEGTLPPPSKAERLAAAAAAAKAANAKKGK